MCLVFVVWTFASLDCRIESSREEEKFSTEGFCAAGRLAGLGIQEVRDSGSLESRRFAGLGLMVEWVRYPKSIAERQGDF